MPEVDEDDLEAELDALGEDFALDDDTSYLDDAIAAPSVPSRCTTLLLLPLPLHPLLLLPLHLPPQGAWRRLHRHQPGRGGGGRVRPPQDPHAQQLVLNTGLKLAHFGTSF